MEAVMVGRVAEQVVPSGPNTTMGADFFFPYRASSSSSSDFFLPFSSSFSDFFLPFSSSSSSSSMLPNLSTFYYPGSYARILPVVDNNNGNNNNNNNNNNEQQQ